MVLFFSSCSKTNSTVLGDYWKQCYCFLILTRDLSLGISHLETDCSCRNILGLGDRACGCMDSKSFECPDPLGNHSKGVLRVMLRRCANTHKKIWPKSVSQGSSMCEPGFSLRSRFRKLFSRDPFSHHATNRFVSTSAAS
jgi:hypothetical protein